MRYILFVDDKPHGYYEIDDKEYLFSYMSHKYYTDITNYISEVKVPYKTLSIYDSYIRGFIGGLIKNKE